MICPPGCIAPTDIISGVQVRAMAKIKSRTTLIAWRREHGFPEPVATVPGPGGIVELWDRRAVKSWLDGRR